MRAPAANTASNPRLETRACKIRVSPDGDLLFSEDIRYMNAYRLWAYLELLGDLLIRPALGNQHQNFLVTFS